MEITEVRIKLVEKSTERLRAFCSVTLDGDFVVRDLKIIDGSSGPFVAMPSRKLMDRCTRCSAKNHLRAKFCNECGQRLNENRAPKDSQGRAKLHADVAHPINAACRERIQKAVVQAYQEELERAKSPDYRPASYDEFEDFEDIEIRQPESKPQQQAEAPKNEDNPSDSGFDDYNELIADLKRQAETRHGERKTRQPDEGESSAPLYSEDAEEPDEKSPKDQSDPEEMGSPSPRAAPSESDESDDEFGSGL
jgi:stage V sporulation protein G